MLFISIDVPVSDVSCGPGPGATGAGATGAGASCATCTGPKGAWSFCAGATGSGATGAGESTGATDLVFCYLWSL